jgi:hypothetical protein
MRSIYKTRKEHFKNKDRNNTKAASKRETNIKQETIASPKIKTEKTKRKFQNDKQI